MFFFVNDTATPEIYTLSLHDALPILARISEAHAFAAVSSGDNSNIIAARVAREQFNVETVVARIYDAKDRKSTRLNSSHSSISYAVFCLKKKKNTHYRERNQHEAIPN